MTLNEKIEKIGQLRVSQGMRPPYIPGPATQSAIQQVEDLLQVNLPEDYRNFLATYGAFGLGDSEVFGIDDSNEAEDSGVVCNTLANREEYNVPHKYVALLNQPIGDVICLTTDNRDTHKIVFFNIYNQTISAYPHAKDFDEFFEKHLEAIIQVYSAH